MKTCPSCGTQGVTLGRYCKRGHLVAGDNAKPNSARPASPRCRICVNMLAKAKYQPRPRGPGKIHARRVELVEDYEFILSSEGGSQRDIAVRLGVTEYVLKAALAAVT